MLEIIRKELESLLPKRLVSELLEAYEKVKNNFYTDHLRYNELEGGRFAEAVFRILEQRTRGNYTPLDDSLDTEKIINDLAGMPRRDQPDSVRLHIPRTLRVLYDIRTKRDVAHLADKIDPNTQDAIFVVACCDWVMAELVRLYHSVSSEEAQLIIENLVTKKVSVVQKFGDFLKTLRPSLGSSDRILVLLFYRSKKGALNKDLTSWLKPKQRRNIKRTLRILEYEKDFIHSEDSRYFITKLGERYVEERKLLKPNFK